MYICICCMEGFFFVFCLVLFSFFFFLQYRCDQIRSQTEGRRENDFYIGGNKRIRLWLGSEMKVARSSSIIYTNHSLPNLTNSFGKKSETEERMKIAEIRKNQRKNDMIMWLETSIIINECQERNKGQ